ncbi:asparagine synthase-related protein [Dyadobacter sp. LHD-138]|uniref:asparagine synthase-related protein n=1 Tax=Dyadobacter sp. LHD-138 TaxID=3071413 RepID=UPI0027DFF30F|nr:asparagine synthase-related protein [Dyadobacter sp. LHD-138]MDQ6478909.1 asparagine synthase-related protein [Dyadobacter sp. LHD-138]
MILQGCIYFENNLNLHKGGFLNDNIFFPGNLFFSRFDISTRSEFRDSSNFVAFNQKSTSSKLINSQLYSDCEFISLSTFDNIIRQSADQPEIALWYNDITGELKLFRNVLSGIPIYYINVESKFFAFSTQLVSLLQIDQVKQYLKINSKWIAQYLTFGTSQSYSSDTVYTRIKRLLPGHSLHVSNSASIREFPDFEFYPQKWKHLKSVEEFGEVFKSLFKESVERSMSGENLITAQLSGGIDSSSICSMIKSINPDSCLDTVFIDLPNIKRSEKHFALDVAKRIGAKFHSLSPSTNDLHFLSLHTSLYGRPEEMISGSALTGTMFEFANEIGSNNMFSGHDGDGIVGIGIEYPEMLYNNYRWTELQEILSFASTIYSRSDINRNWDSLTPSKKKHHYIASFLFKQLKHKAQKLPYLEFIAHAREVNSFFGTSILSSVLKKISYSAIDKIKDFKIYPNTILNEEIMLTCSSQNENSIRLPDVMKQGLYNIDTTSFDDIYGGESITIMENLYTLGSHYQVLEKFPFYDKNLFELGMSAPLTVKYDMGRLRGYLRAGMKGILPESVRTRGDKGKFSLYGRDVAIRLYAQAYGTIINDNSPVWEFVDKQKFKLVTEILHKNEQPGKATFHVLRTIALAVWLEWLHENKILD